MIIIFKRDLLLNRKTLKITTDLPRGKITESLRTLEEFLAIVYHLSSLPAVHESRVRNGKCRGECIPLVSGTFSGIYAVCISVKVISRKRRGPASSPDHAKPQRHVLSRLCNLSDLDTSTHERFDMTRFASGSNYGRVSLLRVHRDSSFSTE